MKTKEKTLFIFEGAKTEDNYIGKLEGNFLGEEHAIKCVYGAEIYQLYRAIMDEGRYSIDIVSILKERNKKNAETLKDYDRDSFAYIYLFFDYDPHADKADDDKIKELISFFRDETEEGRLYISYPMVEAIRHYKDIESFRILTVKCKRKNCPYIEECTDREGCLKEPHYKEFSAIDTDHSLTQLDYYTKAVWQKLITAHLCKGNYLINEVFDLPSTLIGQDEIFAKQLEKHINRKCPQVAVLSAFPFYVLDYYGVMGLRKKLN